MDYKLNRLSKELKCEDVGIPDIPALKFGRLDDDTLLFNATQFLKSIDREEIDYKTFSRPMRFWIEQMAKGYGVGIDKLFYLNPSGDELYSEILTHLFLMFIDPSTLTYYNDIVDDVVTNGIAFSDSFVLELAQSRLPAEYFKPTIVESGDKKSSNLRQST